eukprot:CAMPEP_0203978444 /NCGR_PEP_ID=MMETSP0359-20131031/102120_1 /ASSEMBLY_ACC=CAM_ASM_000338 /TAXON_ID=268821 /ORGANISM="Scrippsiella Hangoei, Strain SHTV-5" /LENGTH=132 /DNA_ID=CAMNT_0050916655 /DNA_START=521 /DNA_END=919 /DNA_ORIENTATION=-
MPTIAFRAGQEGERVSTEVLNQKTFNAAVAFVSLVEWMLLHVARHDGVPAGPMLVPLQIRLRRLPVRVQREVLLPQILELAIAAHLATLLAARMDVREQHHGAIADLGLYLLHALHDRLHAILMVPAVRVGV